MSEHNFTLIIEIDFNEFTKSRRVGVFVSFALPKASRTGFVSRTYFSIPFTVLPLPALAFSEIFKKSKSGPSNPVAACAR